MLEDVTIFSPAELKITDCYMHEAEVHNWQDNQIHRHGFAEIMTYVTTLTNKF